MKYNYNFGVLEEGNLKYAPKPITIDGAKFCTNREELHRQAGYFPIVRTELPVREGYYYTESWQTEGTPAKIVQHWVEHQNETEPEL